MGGDCRLASARQVGVLVTGTRLEIRALGVPLEAGEAGRIQPVLSETGRYRVLACPDSTEIAARVVAVDGAFDLPLGMARVVVEDAGGSQAFDLLGERQCHVCGAMNGASEQFCGNCGAFLDFVSAPAPQGMQPPSAPLPPSAAPGSPMSPPMSSALPPLSPSEPRPAPQVGSVSLPSGPPLGRDITISGGGGFTFDLDLPPDMSVDDLADAAAPMDAADDPIADTAAIPASEGAASDSAGSDDAAPDDAVSDDDAPDMASPDAAAPDEKPIPRFPRIDAPPFAVVGVPIDVTIGVAPTQDPKVGGGGPMELPPTVGDTFILSVQLIADGFSREDGTDVWEFDLAVTPKQPHPTQTLRIVANAIPERAVAAVLRVLYSVESQVIGEGERALAIVTEAGAADEVKLPEVAVRKAMALPVGATPADLTVVILADHEVDGKLLWAYRSPHAETPKNDRITHIGSKSDAFADGMRRQAEQAEGKSSLRSTLIGIGRQIATKVDDEFWHLFKEVAAAVGGRPSILFLLEEPHVPWELAVLPEDEFPGEPRFVATEAVTGRWVLTGGPKVPPPELVEMKHMAVVFGEYTNARLQRLVEAEEEAKELTTTYPATSVHAKLDEVQAVLEGTPPAEVLHFAIHGRFNEPGADLLMEDGQPLTATAVLGSTLASRPFVFLNACQTGAANSLLGSYSGLVAAFTVRGAAAAVAPLWKVSDTVAKELSLKFYVAAFGGERPAELLRKEREAFATNPTPASATPMAYLFYGHPAFRLTRGEQPNG